MTTSNIGPAQSSLVDLESEASYAQLDASGMRQRLRALPEQCRAAWQQAASLAPPQSWDCVDRIVVGGMGGSAIAGDLVGDLAALQGAVPVTVIRDFRLPFNLDPKSLFIACSHSGETEETLALFHQAQRQGTPLLAVAGGGGLANEAASAGVPLLIINAPGEPRSAVGYNLMLLLGALAVGGIVKIDQSQVETAIAGLEAQIGRLAEDVREKDNVAKQMARELVGRLVVVYGGGLFTGMARRWKTQLNENAKAWAFHESIPELLHNSVEAFDAPGPVAQDKMALVLKPSTDSAQLEGRYKVVLELLRLKNIPHRIVEATPGPPLAQQLSMLALGDYVSYYLALLQGIDPSPVPAIDLGKDLSNDV